MSLLVSLVARPVLVLVVLLIALSCHHFHSVAVVEAATFGRRTPFATLKNQHQHLHLDLVRNGHLHHQKGYKHADENSNESIILSLRGGGRASRNRNRKKKSSSLSTDLTALPLSWEGIPLTYNQTSSHIGSTPTLELLSSLQSNPSMGLSTEEASKRLSPQYYGRNKLLSPKGKSLLGLTLEQFSDKLVQILLAVAVLSGTFSYFEMVQHAAETGESQSVIKSFIEPIVILSILILNAIVGVWQSKSAEGSLEALKKLQPSLATVLRDGQWLEGVDAADLVPGDIIRFRVGDKIPADARVLSLGSSILSLDEGSLTGESVTVQKLPGDEGLVGNGDDNDDGNINGGNEEPVLQDMHSVVFSGTVCTAGSATAVVVRTGMETEMGKIQQGVTEAKSEEHKTPLGIKLDEFGETLTKIIGVICVAVWAVSFPKWGDATFQNVWEGGIYYAKVAVALGVAAIPEGLPAVITLCLSLGTRRMARKNVIVRKLPSVETLGSTSVICTDKTGTLTTNEMTAVSLVLFEKAGPIVEHPILGSSYSPTGSVEGIISGEEIRSTPYGAVADVAAVSALCNDAKIIGNDIAVHEKKTKSKRNKEKKSEKQYERVGEPTEAALCILAEKLGGMASFSNDVAAVPSVLASANVNGWRENFPRSATLEFNRDRKSMSVLCRPVSSKKGNRLLVKGAPNLLIKRCTHVKFRDGTVMKLTGDLRRKIEAKTSDLAQRPLRCLALAVKETQHLDQTLKMHSPAENEGDGDAARNHPLLKDQSKYADIESGLTLVGVVGIKDPARPEVADSIQQCTEAGIRVIMITGDARDTAIAIARDVNIFPKHSDDGEVLKAFEGREFFNKPDFEQLELLKSGNIVFCRAEPSDKQKLIRMLQSLGEISAMTGDGVNDAPALQQADIGVAMGITGTEVSKQAADMILVDDNFSTIVNAIEEGRCIYANMQAFICFLISCNIGEICAILLATLSGVPEPLTAMHLLWVNLVTDGPPATALGFNPPVPDLMKQPPRPSDEPIMTPWLITRYCLTGLYVGIATVGIFVSHYLNHGVSLSELSKWGKCGASWFKWDISCDDLFTGHGRMLPQTLSLTTLVCMEMFKALSAVSVDNSLLSVGPHRNPLLILGVTFPMMLHLLVVYSSDLGLKSLGESFGMVALSRENWISILRWSAPILIVEEVLKAIGRKVNKMEPKQD